jgi:hypothetical protein
VTVIKFPLSPLGRVIDEHKRALGCSLKSLTVLAPENDPFRADPRRPASEWFAHRFFRFYGEGNRTAHIRAFFYLLVSAGNIVKPSGETFTNTERDWDWLCCVSTDARYLGLIPFERIIDNGFSDPVKIDRNSVDWVTSVDQTFSLWEFDADEDIGIDPKISGFETDKPHLHQPYHLVLFGEKSSLAEIVSPICKRFGADEYLGAGELSLTHTHDLAKRAVASGRTLVFFTLCDADPSGWQMPISLGRKLRAFREVFLPTLDARVIRVGLTPQQAASFNLPSTPLKDTEVRADKWKEATGREQTEIDAMIALYPRELGRMLTEAMAKYFDAGLADRVREARSEWRDAAEQAIEDQVGAELAELREDAKEIIGPYNSAIAGLRTRFNRLTRDIYLPEPEMPEPEIDEPDSGVLADTRWTYLRETQALKAEKAYSNILGDDEAA